MTPIGKLTLAVLGLRLFGIDGLLWGMLLGHVIIDRSLVKKFIKTKLSELDDTIRLLLPYRLYCIYNQIHDNGFGKIWGAILGAVAYGWNGLIVFCIFGHFLFDRSSGRELRYAFEDFWNGNLGKLAGGIIGFATQRPWLIFLGVVIGFVIDEYRMGGGFQKRFKTRFWSKINLIKLALRSTTAKDMSFVRSMAGLAAKIAKADGAVSENEIRVFKKIFCADRNPRIARIFNDAKQSTDGYEQYARQLKMLSQNNLDMKENIIENLFKIAVADGDIGTQEQEMFDRIAEIIEIPQGNYSIIKDRFIAKPKDEQSSGDYEILGVFYNASDKEIKRRWIELINTYHPDKIQAAGGSSDEIAAATAKMAAINSAYEHIMKQRKAV